MSETRDPAGPGGAAGAPRPRLRVVIVGRPNVGKSALFNRLVGQRRSLVHDLPGMTRDSLEGVAKTSTGREYTLVDTGGLDLDAPGGFSAWTTERAMTAVLDADLLLFVLDGSQGLLPEDRRIAARLHALGKPVLVAWNKSDHKSAREGIGEAHELGFDVVAEVSAIHGTGTEDLDNAIEKHLPPDDLDPATRLTPLTIAIVGRPNVGKSTLVNALLGEHRVMVSEIAGTTRDAIDVPLERDGRQYLLVDTAGIRRKGRTTDDPEVLSIVAARKAIERARVVVIVFDAEEGITTQDQHIAGYAEEAGRGLLLVANKWDLIDDDLPRKTALRDDAERRFVFARGAAFLTLSALKGRGINRILPEADALAKRFATRMSTGELNRVIQKATDLQTPRTRGGRDLKIRYAVQVASEPPLIRLFADRSEALHFSYERFLQNRIREKWKLDGVPVRFIVKPGEEPARPDQKVDPKKKGAPKKRNAPPRRHATVKGSSRTSTGRGSKKRR